MVDPFEQHHFRIIAQTGAQLHNARIAPRPIRKGRSDIIEEMLDRVFTAQSVNTQEWGYPLKYNLRYIFKPLRSPIFKPTQ